MFDGSGILTRVTAVDYKKEDGEVIVQLAGRDEDGCRRTLEVEDTVPYFYIREQDSHLVRDHEGVLSIEDGYESFDHIPLSRVNVRNPSYVGDNGQEENLTKRFDYTPWESDIPYYRRVSIDYNLSGHIRVPDADRCSIDEIETDVQVDGADEIDPRILIADIEVLPGEDKSFDEMKEEAESPISHISMWDSHTDEYIALHLDPDGRVEPERVSGLLDEHIASQSLSREAERDIHLRSYQNASDLAQGFIRTIERRRPDMVSGWNFVDFDWDYIIDYFESLDDVNPHDLSDIGWIEGYHTERKVDCLPSFDMMDAYKKMTAPAGDKKRSYALDYIAKEELGMGKIPNVDIRETYEARRNELVAYNIMDTMLCVALDRTEDIHDFFYELAELSQVQIYDTFSEMRLIDGYIMSRADDDEILPAQEKKDIDENAGGLVFEPADGISENVGVLDLKSLYPSGIITGNISTETLTKDEDEADIIIPWMPEKEEEHGGKITGEDIVWDIDMGVGTTLETEGIVPKYIRKLFPEREERKEKRNQYDPGEELYDIWDRKQYVVKVLMNSFYGVMSNDYWRLAVPEMGDAVTAIARYVIWRATQISEELGFSSEYGDTDSIMVELASSSADIDEVKRRGHELEDKVNERMDKVASELGIPERHPYLAGKGLHGNDRHCFVFEFEKLYRRFFQAGTKKRYAGLIVWKEGKSVDGEIDMVGFESRRSDSPELTSEIQPEVVRMILSGEGFKEVSEYVRGLINDIKEQEIEMYKVALPATLNKPLQEYGNTPTVRACRHANRYFGEKWNEGDDPWIYHVSSTPTLSPKTDVIALSWDEDIPEGFELNMEKILERAMKAPLNPILNEVNWRFEELKQGAKTQSAAEASWSSVEVNDEGSEDEWGW